MNSQHSFYIFLFFFMVLCHDRQFAAVRVQSSELLTQTAQFEQISAGSQPVNALVDSLNADSFIITPDASRAELPPASGAEIESTIDMLDSLVLQLENSSAYIPATSDTIVDLKPSEVPRFSVDEISRQLAGIPTNIPLQYNAKVGSFINVYTRTARNGTSKMLGLSQLYFPIFEEELDRRQMPFELKYLPIIESALNQHAVSRRGATGLWQIMYRTGRGLGLRIDTYVDERRDPYKSTEAALDYLQQLHGIYGDWLLTVAAYNCGPGNVNKAIRLSGGKRNVWEIYPWLPRETRGYVPGFIAAIYTFNFYPEYNLYPRQPIYEYEMTDTVMFTRNVPLSLIADSLGMGSDDLYFLNPALKRKVIPGRSAPYPLRIPFSKMGDYLSSLDCLLEAAEATEHARTVEVASRPGSSSPRAAAYFDPAGKTKLSYTIKSGDNLGFIATWYDCRVSELRMWNGISGNRIRIGQKLNIYKTDKTASKFRDIDNMSFEQKQALVGKLDPQISASNKVSDDYFWYEIRQGDTLWELSQKYPGNSIEKIMGLNELSLNSKLKPGSKLKLVK